MNLKATISSALSGLVAAVLVDIHAWSKSDGAFDWGCAIKRWVAGAVSGLLAGTGVNSL